MHNFLIVLFCSLCFLFGIALGMEIKTMIYNHQEKKKGLKLKVYCPNFEYSYLYRYGDIFCIKETDLASPFYKIYDIVFNNGDVLTGGIDDQDYYNFMMYKGGAKSGEEKLGKYLIY